MLATDDSDTLGAYSTTQCVIEATGAGRYAVRCVVWLDSSARIQETRREYWLDHFGVCSCAALLLPAPSKFGSTVSE